MNDYENRHYQEYDFYERDDSVEWEIGEIDIYIPNESYDEEIPF